MSCDGPDILHVDFLLPMALGRPGMGRSARFGWEPADMGGCWGWTVKAVTQSTSLLFSEVSLAGERWIRQVEQESAMKTNQPLGCIYGALLVEISNVIISLCSPLLRLHLEFCVYFWSPQFKKTLGCSKGGS